MSKNKQVQKRWKVPVPIKVAMAIIGTMFILIEIVGSSVQG
jgi:hypothetical protein